MSGKTSTITIEAQGEYVGSRFINLPIGGLFHAGHDWDAAFMNHSYSYVKTGKNTAFCFETDKGSRFADGTPVELITEINITRTYED